MNPTSLSILSALATAAWSIWTWKSERQKERDIERNEMSAQFVNNLIAATQELQRSLYKILEEDELAFYKKEYPNGGDPASPAAIEFLYILNKFFGWEVMTLRFGPYTRDGKMIAIMAKIRDTFDSRHLYPGEAFRVNFSHRHALADSVLRRVGDHGSRPAFIQITRYQFEDEMRNLKGERVQLFSSKCVRSMLAAIDNADRPDLLEGRQRLEALQNQLVDLITYLERQEGFSMHFGKRARAGESLRDEAVDDDASVFVLHKMSGRLRLGVPRLHQDERLAQRLQSQIESLNLVESVRVNPDAACIVINHSRNIAQQVFITAAMQAVRDVLENTATANTVTKKMQKARV